MIKTSSELPKSWIGKGSTSLLPPSDYWKCLKTNTNSEQVEKLKQISDQRVREFNPSLLDIPKKTAIELLEHLTADGWLEKKIRISCPNCHFQLTEEDIKALECPECTEVYDQHGGVVTETVYTRNLAINRTVDWVVAIHGMNTSGAWQEAFSWHLSTTWGRSVPVAIYKYGIVIAGVIMVWRRRKLRDQLRNKLLKLYYEANEKGFSGKPDVIAHSFGTWLLGHLLEKELIRNTNEQLKFGRIILTGSILRPDFNWEKIKEVGLVEEVLNHCSSKDIVVPLAHYTIWDSGPSGKYGFNSDQVLNIRTEGCGHSDLFSIDKCLVNGKVLKVNKNVADEKTLLEYSYKRYWRPFLTLPHNELHTMSDQIRPLKVWHQLQWLLRGTVFPILILPLISLVIIIIVNYLSRIIWSIQNVLLFITSFTFIGLLVIFVLTTIVIFYRKFYKR